MKKSKADKKNIRQKTPYVYVREEIPNLVTFEGLTPKEVLINSIIVLINRLC